MLRLKVVPLVDASLAPSNHNHQLLLKILITPTRPVTAIKILISNETPLTLQTTMPTGEARTTA